MQIPPETRYASCGDLSIAYQVFGQGPPLVTTLEMPCHLDLAWIDPAFTEILRRLASFATVVLFDRAGLGLSDPVSHVPTTEELADHVEAVMDAAGVQRATLWALGTANPGFVLLAARAPHRVDSLVLWGVTAAGYLSPVGPAHYGTEGYDFATVWFDDVLPNWGQGHSLRAWAPGLDSDRARRGWAMLERASAGPKMVRAITQAGWEADLHDVLPLIQAPTLVMVNSDGGQPVRIAEHAASLIPGSRFEVLPASTEAAGVADYFRRPVDLVREVMTGGRATDHAGERVLATVLFTDIVDSTTTATRLGDERWRIVLERHDAIVRDHVAAAGGRVVKSTGDGCLAAFDGPARAIRCAEALVAALAAVDVHIRAGLHAGECEVRGDDLAGLAVHIAARVSAESKAGEVLVSRTVRDLVAGSGLSFQSRGEHTFKGLDGSWELFALAPGASPPVAVSPEDPPVQPADRVVLSAARRAPAVLRLAARLRGGP